MELPGEPIVNGFLPASFLGFGNDNSFCLRANADIIGGVGLNGTIVKSDIRGVGEDVETDREIVVSLAVLDLTIFDRDVF